MEADRISPYYRRIAEQISRALEEKGITQKHLAKECKSRFGIEISQSTISKILHSEGGHMSTIFVCAICQTLGIDLLSALRLQEEEHGNMVGEDMIQPSGAFADPGIRETLIRRPRDDVFFGYIDRTYDIFFWPTHSRENKLIGGIMTLSNEEDKRCKVYIRLDTGKQPEKEYYGTMAISLLQQACYCTVESKRLAERCTFVFSHRFFSQGALRSVIASVATVSVGNVRRPAMHRMAICEQGAVDTDQKRNFVASQLLLNNSSIIISEEKMELLRKDENLRALLDALDLPGRSKNYHIYDEFEIRMLPNQDFHTLANAVAKLRLHAVAQHYNKIGGKVDDFLYQYLFKNTTQDYTFDE